MTLYDIEGEYLYLLELAEDPDTDPQVFADTMEGLEGVLEDKVEAYGKVIRQMEHDAAACDYEAKRLRNKKDSIEANIKRMKDRIQEAMTTTGKKKIDTTLFKFSIRKNPPKVVLDSPEHIPAGFLIPQDPKVDLAAIKESLKSEDEAPIWEGIAHLEQGESLSIR